jgi:hypothetical protein
VFKTLLYTIVLTALFIAVLTSIVTPLINEIFVQVDIIEQLKIPIDHWLRGEITSSGELFRAIRHAISFKPDATGMVLVNVIILYVLLMFFMHMTNIPITNVLFNKMSQGYNERFHMSLIASLPKSIVYSFITAVTGSIIDLLIFFGCMSLLSALYTVFNIFTLTITIAIILILVAGRVTLFSQWAPIIICENKKVLPSLLEAIKSMRSVFVLAYPSILLAMIIFFAIFMTTIAVTFAIVPIIVIPAYIVLLQCIGLTSYFTSKNRKYYISDGLRLSSQSEISIISGEFDDDSIITEPSEVEPIESGGELPNTISPSESETPVGAQDDKSSELEIAEENAQANQGSDEE